jgi:hypothetical protein
VRCIGAFVAFAGPRRAWGGLFISNFLYKVELYTTAAYVTSRGFQERFDVIPIEHTTMVQQRDERVIAATFWRVSLRTKPLGITQRSGLAFGH